MSESSFDLIVIGSGPGGYVAAIRSSQLGLKTAIIEKSDPLGGTCLNVGCIPSKALLHSTEMYHFATHSANEHGIEIPSASIKLEKMMAQKDKVVTQLRNGVTYLMKKNRIEVFHGLGSLTGEGKVKVQNGKGKKTLRAPHIIIATGSSPVELPSLPFDGKAVVRSDEAIAFKQVPEKLAVVGAGAIGLELGSIWARLGSEVNVVEFLPQIASGYDKEVSKAAEVVFKKQGLHFHLDTKVTGIKKTAKNILLTVENKKGEKAIIEANKILVAVGRKPNTENLNLEAASISTDAKGCIPVDSHFQTSAQGIYAIGDVIAGPMLAHKAEEEAIACVECIAGQAGHVNYNVIPNVIYTDPEIANIGMTEAMAREKGIAIKTGKFNFLSNGRAIAAGATDGFVKIVADKETDRLLGVQVISRGASEMIAAAVAHMEYGGSAEDLARTIHAHPTMSEAMKEAALAVDGRAIHG